MKGLFSTLLLLFTFFLYSQTEEIKNIQEEIEKIESLNFNTFVFEKDYRIVFQRVMSEGNIISITPQWSNYSDNRIYSYIVQPEVNGLILPAETRQIKISNSYEQEDFESYKISRKEQLISELNDQKRIQEEARENELLRLKRIEEERLRLKKFKEDTKIEIETIFEGGLSKIQDYKNQTLESLNSLDDLIDVLLEETEGFETLFLGSGLFRSLDIYDFDEAFFRNSRWLNIPIFDNLDITNPYFDTNNDRYKYLPNSVKPSFPPDRGYSDHIRDKKNLDFLYAFLNETEFQNTLLRLYRLRKSLPIIRKFIKFRSDYLLSDIPMTRTSLLFDNEETTLPNSLEFWKLKTLSKLKCYKENGYMDCNEFNLVPPTQLYSLIDFELTIYSELLSKNLKTIEYDEIINKEGFIISSTYMSYQERIIDDIKTYKSIIGALNNIQNIDHWLIEFKSQIAPTGSIMKTRLKKWEQKFEYVLSEEEKKIYNQVISNFIVTENDKILGFKKVSTDELKDIFVDEIRLNKDYFEISQRRFPVEKLKQTLN